MPKRAPIFFFLFSFLAFFCGNARAQDEAEPEAPSEVERLRQEIADLRERLDAIEGSAGDTAAPAPETTGGFGLGELDFDISLTNGISLKSLDGNYQFHLGGRVQADFRGFESDYPTVSQFLVRRARIDLEAKFYKTFTFFVQGDFAGAGAVLTDGYGEIQLFPELAIRLGQFYVPFTLEDSAMSDNTLILQERSFAITNIGPERDIGAMIRGNVGKGLFEYWVGIFNGVGRNRTDNNDDKDGAIRLIFRPFRLFMEDKHLLSGIQVGGSATYGHQNLAIAGNRFTTSGGTAFLTFAPFTRAFERRIRIGAEFAWFGGPFAVIAEALLLRFDHLELVNPAALPLRKLLDTYGYTATASVMVTGENRRADGIWHEDEYGVAQRGPHNPFNPAEGGWGAIEVGARWSQIDTERDALGKGFVIGATRADAFAAGVTWWLRENVRFMVGYERVLFDRELNRPKFTVNLPGGAGVIPGTGVDEINNEDVFFARFAIWF